MLSPSVKEQFTSWVAFLASNDFVQLKSTTSEKTNGARLLQWKIRDITLAHVPSVMNISMLSVDSMEALNKKSMIASKWKKLKKISGLVSEFAWRTLFGLAAHLLFQTVKFSWLEVKIRIETVKFTCSTSTPRAGNLSIKWTNLE